VAEAARATALALVVADGYANLTMERIADRSGVSKAALYRRWPNKLAVLVDAIEEFNRDAVMAPDTGSVRDDIRGFLARMSRDHRHDVETFDALIAAVESDHELAERSRAVVADQVSAAFRTIVTRGVWRGELAPDTDVDLVADLVPALLRYHRQTTGHPPDAAYLERIADQFFTANRAIVIADTGGAAGVSPPGRRRRPSGRPN
jgi:AcrR family transcriptional regulator